MFGVTSGGKRELVTPHLAGLNKTGLTATYLQPMWLGDSAVAQKLLHRLNRGRKDPFVELRIEAKQYTLVGDSIVPEDIPGRVYKLNTSEPR